MPEPTRFSLRNVLLHPDESTPYGRGVVDVLRLLGLISAEDALPSGEVAAMMLASLAAHATDGIRVGIDWNGLDRAGLRGVDILRAMEESRVARGKDPTPGRVVRVVQAVIKATQDGRDVYLLEYDVHAGQYQPIGGKWDASDRDGDAALRREIAEELGLVESPSSELCTLTPLLAGWGTMALSATYGILTQYAFDFYHVTGLAVDVPSGGDVRWVSLEELAQGMAVDGRAISTIYAEALGFEAIRDLSAG